MRCEDYFDQALTSGASQAEIADNAELLGQHLVNCRDCLALSPLVSKLLNVKPVKLAPNFLERLLQALETAAPGPEELSCEEAEPELSAFIDGELDAALEEAMVIHLAGCDPCTAELSQLYGVSAALGRQLSTPALPANFARSVTQAAQIADREAVVPVSTQDSTMLRIHPRPWGAWLSAAAAVLLASVIGLQMFESERENSVAQKPSEFVEAGRVGEGTSTVATANNNSKIPSPTAPTQIPNLAGSGIDPENRAELAARGAGLASPMPEQVLLLTVADLKQAKQSLEALLREQDIDAERFERDGELTTRIQVSAAQWQRLALRLPTEASSKNNDTVTPERGAPGLGSPEMPASAPPPKADHKKGRVFDPEADLRAKSAKPQDIAKRKESAGEGKAEREDAESKVLPGSTMATLDRVVLRSGWTISGQVSKEDDQGITLLSAGRPITIPRAEIREITRGFYSPYASPTQRVRIILRQQ